MIEKKTQKMTNITYSDSQIMQQVIDWKDFLEEICVAISEEICVAISVVWDKCDFADRK